MHLKRQEVTVWAKSSRQKVAASRRKRDLSGTIPIANPSAISFVSSQNAVYRALVLAVAPLGRLCAGWHNATES